MTPPTVLAVESSCDETAAAVCSGRRVRSSVVATQIEVHRPFGGIVPELAGRHHLRSIVPVIRAALADAGLSGFEELDALAVTQGPGLVGALLVGVQAARGLAAATGLPLVGVHHMEGHIFSVFLQDDAYDGGPFVPHVALLVSGGHTELVEVRGLGRYTLLGATRDDAAGEAYDKVAKLLGLGYPGGPVIDRLASRGDPTAVDLPRAMLGDGLDFSFSGLKTAVAVHLDRHGLPETKPDLWDLCASFQAAVVDVLVEKAGRAVAETGLGRLHVAGGVAANRGLRTALAARAEADGFVLACAPPRYCGDNAAMIAAAAAARVARRAFGPVSVRSSVSLEDPQVALP